MMTCRVCRSEKVHEIDTAGALGESTRSLAARFGLSKSSIARHRLGRHVPPQPPSPIQAGESLSSVAAALVETRRIYAAARGIADGALKAGKIGDAISAIRELRANLADLVALELKVEESRRTAEDMPRMEALAKALALQLGVAPESMKAYAAEFATWKEGADVPKLPELLRREPDVIYRFDGATPLPGSPSLPAPKPSDPDGDDDDPGDELPPAAEIPAQDDAAGLLDKLVETPEPPVDEEPAPDNVRRWPLEKQLERRIAEPDALPEPPRASYAAGMGASLESPLEVRRLSGAWFDRPGRLSANASLFQATSASLPCANCPHDQSWHYVQRDGCVGTGNRGCGCGGYREDERELARARG